MTTPVQQFGVKYKDADGNDFQVNEKFDDSASASDVAQKIYSEHGDYRDVRVVDASELESWDEPKAEETSKPEAVKPEK